MLWHARKCVHERYRDKDRDRNTEIENNEIKPNQTKPNTNTLQWDAFMYAKRYWTQRSVSFHWIRPTLEWITHIKIPMMHGFLLFRLTSIRFNEFYNWTWPHALCSHLIHFDISKVIRNPSWKKKSVFASLYHWSNGELIHCYMFTCYGQFQLICNVRYWICWTTCQFQYKTPTSSWWAPNGNSSIPIKLYTKQKIKLK